MTRTKVSKSSKRNREVANRQETIRDFNSSLDAYVNTLETQVDEIVDSIDRDIRQLLQRTCKPLLQMKMGDFFELGLNRFNDFSEKGSFLEMSTSNSVSQSINNCTSAVLLRSAKVSNPNDEGYLTEDSSSTGTSGVDAAILGSFKTSNTAANTQQQQKPRGRTPGPLNSARARRPRRSRSACEDYIIPSSAIKSKQINNLAPINSTNDERMSRSKMRTPLATRTKAFSADRTPLKPLKTNITTDSPPTAFMRWPKPGEMVLSAYGSPVVAQVLPDKFANVNIPIRDGVLSLRPKKLSELKPDLIESMNPETLNQIKTLHENLTLIMNMAEDAANK